MTCGNMTNTNQQFYSVTAFKLLTFEIRHIFEYIQTHMKHPSKVAAKIFVVVTINIQEI